jgi:hypothetical protein
MLLTDDQKEQEKSFQIKNQKSFGKADSILITSIKWA